MKIQRLNMDSSWWMEIDDVSFILDPWLKGSEVDMFSWLNEQWHNTDSVSIKDIPPFHFIFITQPYSDHCHEPTLSEMPNKPVYANSAAFKRLKKNKVSNPLFAIEKIADDFPSLKIYNFSSPRWIDPIYQAVLIEGKAGCVFYAPHGIELNEESKLFLKQKNIHLLITTFSHFKIPEILGGLVNPGLKAAENLIETLNPKFILNTHDEKKRMSGLVARTSKIIFPDLEDLSNRFKGRFIRTDNYKMVEVEY